jgi:hypothetical protein
VHGARPRACYRSAARPGIAPAWASQEKRLDDDDYEVEGAHEREVEKAVEKRDPMAQRIALMTAILSTIGAMVNYASGNAQTEALFLKNQSILRQSQASDQWAYYQSKSTKMHIAAASARLATDPAVRQSFVDERDAEDKSRHAVQAEAVRLQNESVRLAGESDAKLRPHERLALALGALQIGIALSAITVLTRRRWLLWGAGTAAAIGIASAVSALFV